jgi:hypothetical protein
MAVREVAASQEQHGSGQSGREHQQARRLLINVIRNLVEAHNFLIVKPFPCRVYKEKDQLSCFFVRFHGTNDFYTEMPQVGLTYIY